MGGKTIKLSGFPMNATADQVKEFLEKKSGAGSVFAVKVRYPKNITSKSRAFALIQFVTTKDAEFIYNLAQAPQRLWYEIRSYLTVQYMERDIVPNPRKAFFALEDVVMHLGCLISEDKFGVLWTCDSVKVHFGFNMKKIHFFLSHGTHSYKLDLSYDGIWEIQLRRPPAQGYKFLLIQVWRWE